MRRRSMKIAAIVLAASLLSLAALQTESRPEAISVTSTAFVKGPSDRTAFPLRIAPSGRYLIDAEGKPFLVRGDSPWSLLVEPTEEEVDAYLSDRRARGFNTLLVNLIEHRFSTKAPANIYGDRPFLRRGDFSSPNESYFRHVDRVLLKARDMGFLLLLAPAYLGAGGGDEGWYRHLLAASDEDLRQYGRFVAGRYRELGNIVWVAGGDFNPPVKEKTLAIVEGIRRADPSALHTAHADRETDPADFWDGPWLDINTVYTYGSVCSKALGQYAQKRAIPLILLESRYEHEHGTTEERLRAQAYGALLCGAAGHVFGNNPIWHFGGPGLFDAPVEWREALGSRGAQSMAHLANLFSSLPWPQLIPNSPDGILENSSGSDTDGPAVATTADKSTSVIYLPVAQSVGVDLGKLAGPRIRARWFDPSSGEYIPVGQERLEAQRVHTFTPRARNAAGYRDWILILKSQG